MVDSRIASELAEKLRMIADEAPFTSRNGISSVQIEPDHVRLQVQVSPQYYNGSDITHGGLFLTIADTAAGMAVLTDGRNCVTQSCSFQFLRPIREGILYADGTVVHRGRTVSVARAILTDEKGRELGEGTFNMFKVADTL